MQNEAVKKFVAQWHAIGWSLCIDIQDKLLAFASNSPHTLLAGSLRNYNGDGNANATQQ